MDIRITPSVLSGTVNAISSKSYAHRALICAALADDVSNIRIDSFSEDIDATISCLEELGAKISKNDNISSVEPILDNLPDYAKLNCGESGSTLRFLLPVVAATGIDAKFKGKGKLPDRPISPLREEMEEHGVSFSPVGKFPIKISGQLTSGDYNLAGNISSQFVSGLMFALPLLDGDSSITIVPPIESKSYIDMTVEALNSFGIEILSHDNRYYIKGNQQYSAGEFEVEGDWSNASYFLASGVKVYGLKLKSAQGDKEFLKILSDFGAEINFANGLVWLEVKDLNGIEIDASNIPDLVPLLAVVASTARGKTKIYNASRLKIKESNRLEATTKMLTALGADINETDDGFIIIGKEKLTGGTVDSFNDHRIVMAAAVAALNCENDVIIKNADAVNKSYPAFFDDFNSIGGKANVDELR